MYISQLVCVVYFYFYGSHPCNKLAERNKMNEDQTSVEDVSVETDVVGTEEPQESQTEVSQGQDVSETTQETQPDIEGGEAEEPFNKNPEFTKRIETAKENIRKEFGQKAENWDLINRLAATDPDFRLTVIKKMEAAGVVQKGTYEAEKAKVQPSSSKEVPQATSDVDPKLMEAVSKHPAVLYAEEQRKREEAEMKAQAEQTEQFLSNFESRHPDIAKSPTPEMVRKQISFEAQRLIGQDPKLSPEDAFEQAYLWTLHRDKVLQEYKEKGEINGLLRRAQQDTPGTEGALQVPASSGRKLSAEELSAAKQMGVSAEEYRRLVDDPNAGVVD